MKNFQFLFNSMSPFSTKKVSGSEVVGQAKGFQERFEFEENLVFAAPKDIRQNRSRTVINGMPEPTWVGFVADVRPHFVHLCFARSLNVHSHPVWIQRLQQGCVH